MDPSNNQNEHNLKRESFTTQLHNNFRYEPSTKFENFSVKDKVYSSKDSSKKIEQIFDDEENRQSFNKIDSQSKTTKTKCSFCQKAGYVDYLSHNLKDDLCRNVCPMLANVKCSYCGLNAHTFKKCPVWLKKSKEFKINKHLSMLN